MVLGSFFALLLWHGGVMTEFPALLCVQLAFPALLVFSVVPFLRHFCAVLCAAYFMRERAAQRAAAEYLHLAHHLPANTPIVLIYVSLIERYVHIYMRAARCSRKYLIRNGTLW